jgi:hypothetical protein
MEHPRCRDLTARLLPPLTLGPPSCRVEVGTHSML